MSEEKEIKECEFYYSGECIIGLQISKNLNYAAFCRNTPIGKCVVKQLQTAKEENEKLKERNKHLEQVHKVDTHFCTAFINLKDGLVKILNHYYFTRKEYNLESMCILPAIHKLVARHRSKIDKQKEEIDTLTQQNKQMGEAINNIKNICNEDWEDMTVDKFQNQLLQTLKGVE